MKKISCILICTTLVLIILSAPLSAVKIINLNDNSPPNPPELVAPESNPEKRWFKVYCTITDPDDDNIYFRTKIKTSIGWQEPSIWVGPFESGEEKYSLFKSSGPQELTIGYQAKDVHDAESGWSYVDITITKSKANIHYSLFFKLIKNLFPRISTLL